MSQINSRTDPHKYKVLASHTTTLKCKKVIPAFCRQSQSRIQNISLTFALNTQKMLLNPTIKLIVTFSN